MEIFPISNLLSRGEKNRLQMQPPEVLYKKTVLKNFAIFTGKHLCRSLFK